MERLIMESMSPLQAVLGLDALDGDRFLAVPVQTPLRRLFGGQVAAQALRAASMTVDTPRPPHSLHGYFIRPGRPSEGVYFEVERTRDGRAFSTRRVTASQEGKPVFEMLASFHDPEPGADWQEATLPPVPSPQELRTVSFTGLFGKSHPVEIRPVTPPEPGTFPKIHPFWVRVTAPVGPDEASHACLLTYLSDIATVRAACAPGTTAWPGLTVSLDHSVWFHRPARVDQWLLISMDPAAHIGTRGLARGSIQTTDGTLIASVAQEALLRPDADDGHDQRGGPRRT
jgi:acyl-CoA thioesterase-2